VRTVRKSRAVPPSLAMLVIEPRFFATGCRLTRDAAGHRERSLRRAGIGGAGGEERRGQQESVGGKDRSGRSWRFSCFLRAILLALQESRTALKRINGHTQRETDPEPGQPCRLPGGREHANRARSSGVKRFLL